MAHRRRHHMTETTTQDPQPQGSPGTELDAVDAQLAAHLVAQARTQGISLIGPDGLLQRMTKLVVEGALEGELTDHLGYAHGEAAGRNGGNSRNGTRAKTVLTEIGPVELEVPRDRDASFQPKIVRKRQRRLGGVEDLVVSLVAKGLTTGEVAAHLAEIYGAEVSRQTISTITDRVLEGLTAWQSRPLDPVYPVLFIDAIQVKIRGVADCCIVVCDGLQGLPDAISTVWPQAITQTCVVHLLRNSFRYASRKDWAAIARDLRPVYTAPTEAAALDRFAEFAAAWEARYPAIVRLWEHAWAEFVPFLAFDPEIRTIIATTNAIESLNARFRRSVKARGHFPNEQAALKHLYLTIVSLDPTGRGRRRWTNRWKAALNAFDIAFDGRVSAGRK